MTSAALSILRGSELRAPPALFLPHRRTRAAGTLGLSGLLVWFLPFTPAPCPCRWTNGHDWQQRQAHRAVSVSAQPQLPKPNTFPVPSPTLALCSSHSKALRASTPRTLCGHCAHSKWQFFIISLSSRVPLGKKASPTCGLLTAFHRHLASGMNVYKLTWLLFIIFALFMG